MIYFNDANIEKIIIHQVGNKHEGGELMISKNTIEPDETLEAILKTYFFSSFKDSIYYHFISDVDVKDNKVFQIASTVFEDRTQFVNESNKLANHLFEQSYHPKIKPGELYVVYFKNVVVDDEVVDAFGMFKSENKIPFLKIQTPTAGDDIELSHDTGINIKKLDKGCIVFNTEKDAGYKLCMVDIAGKSKEAAYWKDEFLQIELRKDDYYQTQNYLNICKGFVKDVFNNNHGIERADQIDMLNKSAAYFGGNDEFKLQDFEETVIENPEVIDAFKEYKNRIAEEEKIDIQEQFNISPTAVKKSKAQFKSVLKLDKNFHIYIHGDRSRILKGYDEATGLHFYQVYYDEEQ